MLFAEKCSLSPQYFLYAMDSLRLTSTVVYLEMFCIFTTLRNQLDVYVNTRMYLCIKISQHRFYVIWTLRYEKKSLIRHFAPQIHMKFNQQFSIGVADYEYWNICVHVIWINSFRILKLKKKSFFLNMMFVYLMNSRFISKIILIKKCFNRNQKYNNLQL